MYHSGINMPIEKFVFNENKKSPHIDSLLSVFEEISYENEINSFYPVMTKKVSLENTEKEE